MFVLVLKTSVTLVKTTELLGFMVTVRNYITARFVTPGNVDSNCYLNLITLEIVNSHFGSRSGLLELKLQQSPDPELRTLMTSIDIELPRLLEEKKSSQLLPSK